MQFVIDGISNFIAGIGSKISYSVTHMSLTQWGIFGFASVAIGFIALRSRRPN
jgi:choline-glycine betaine transporter